ASSLSRAHQPRRPSPFPYPTLFRSRTVVCRPPAVDGDTQAGGAPGHLYRHHDRPMVDPTASQPLTRELDRRRTRHAAVVGVAIRSEEHTSELQSQSNLVCRLLLEKK